jgi:hypothetical protein
MHTKIKNPWFNLQKAPRFGLTPANWQGTVSCAVFVMLMVTDILSVKNIIIKYACAIALILVFTWLIYSTSDKSATK